MLSCIAARQRARPAAAVSQGAGSCSAGRLGPIIIIIIIIITIIVTTTIIMIITTTIIIIIIIIGTAWPQRPTPAPRPHLSQPPLRRPAHHMIYYDATIYVWYT